MSINYSLMFVTVASIVLILALITYFLYKTRLKKDKKDFFFPLGQSGFITSNLKVDPQGHWYMAKINGVLWKVISDSPCEIGQSIKVNAQLNELLVLKVSKL